jgi:hypothetical protein
MIDPHLSDRNALEAAIELVLKHRERRQEFLDLARQHGWEVASRMCAVDAQVRSLRLPPWRENEIPAMAGVRGKGRASRLLRRMLKRKISKFHPRPLEAIAAAGGGADEKGLHSVETPGASSAAWA